MVLEQQHLTIESIEVREVIGEERILKRWSVDPDVRMFLNARCVKTGGVGRRLGSWSGI